MLTLKSRFFLPQAPDSLKILIYQNTRAPWVKFYALGCSRFCFLLLFMKAAWDQRCVLFAASVLRDIWEKAAWIPV